jgi:methanogenic corrinoid protein MtbC1
MNDFRNFEAYNRLQAAPDGDGNLRGGSDSFLDHALLDRMFVAAQGDDRTACSNVVSEAIAAGVVATDIVDYYIPAVARRLGEGWCTDSTGFAIVTIAVSRLQLILHHLGAGWSDDVHAPIDAPTIMLIVGQDVHHTLGALVLAGQLRRKGVSVKLMLGADKETIATTLRRLVPDAVFLSASCGERLEGLRRIVKAVRTVRADAMPVVIGGTILETAKDIAAIVGADFATNDPDEALALCKLKLPDIAISRSAQVR